MARRRYVPSEKTEVAPAASTPEVKMEGDGSHEAGLIKPEGLPSDSPPKKRNSLFTEIELSDAAFAAMEEQEEVFKTEIEKIAPERKWGALDILQLKSQAARVSRMNAVVKSIYGRMKVDAKFRRQMHQPSMAESLQRAEVQAQRQETLLYRTMGMDPMYEAKIGAAEMKNKPTDFQVIIGGNLSKKHMAAGGGFEGENE